MKTTKLHSIPFDGYVMAACDDPSDKALYRVSTISKNSDYAVVKYASNACEEVSLSELLPSDPSAESGSPQLLNLSFLNEASLLVNLESRFNSKEIFTSLGNIIVAVNPNCDKNKYFSQEIADKCRKSREKTPNVYQSAKDALENVAGSSQTIVLIGESGSGKTEISKNIIKYITEGHDISSKILAGNFILQCFGCAGSALNPTSSRFAASIKISLNHGVPISCIFEATDIEKSRITTRTPNEFNYLVFYLFHNNPGDEFIEEMKKSKSTYKYLGKYQESLKHKNKYCKLQTAFKELGLQEEAKTIWKIVEGILSIGNIEFSEHDYEVSITPATYKYLERVCKLLSINEERFSNTLMQRSRTIGKTVLSSRLDLADCCVQRDSLAGFLYQKLFKWIYFTINSKFSPITSDTYIEILDVCGWESLPTNSLEQLFRNHTNEKLHNFVAESLFRSKSNVNSREIHYTDNQEILNILENQSSGVFKVIDENCFQKLNKETLSQLLQKKLRGNEYFDCNVKEDSFTIYHLAMPVKYSCEGFRSKNFDEVNAEIETCCISSSNYLIQQIFAIAARSGGKLATSKHLKEVNSLLQKLRSEDCQFIYCVRSNERQEPWNFNQRLVLRQVQMCSLIDYLALLRKYTKIKFNHKEFAGKYKDLLRNNANTREIKEFLERMGLSNQDTVVTKESITISQESIAKLNTEYQKICNQYTSPILTLQNWFRKKLNHSRFKRLIHAIIRFQALYRGKKVYTDWTNNKQKVIYIQRWYRNKIFSLKSTSQKKGLYLLRYYLKQKIHRYMRKRYLRLNTLVSSAWFSYKSRKQGKSQEIIKTILYAHIFNRAWIYILRKLKHKSAILIQKNIKGYLCRLKIPEHLRILLETNKLNRSATTIQKHFRAFLTRKKLLKLKTAINQIKFLYTSKKHLSNFRCLLKSTSLIQKHIRMYLLRIKQIKHRLTEFLIKEQGLLENLSFLEHSSLFSKNLPFPVRQDSRLQLLSSLTESSARLAKSKLTASGSLSIQMRQVNPFHIENIYFFCRVLHIDIISDESLIYDPLWGVQLEILHKDCREHEEQIMDIRVGECHSVALTNRGKVFAWGWNDKNQCGADVKRPKIVERLREYRVVQIDCGDDHTIALGSEGEVLTFGDNTRGQLGTGNYQQSTSVYKLPLAPCKQVCAVGVQNYVVTEAGELYAWPLESQGFRQSLPTRILSEIPVGEVSAGHNFLVILAISGIVYSLGNNSEGQLGLGDCLHRHSPEINSFLVSQKEKVAGISCGLSHCLARTSLGKVYSWGSGSRGKLGHGGTGNELTPRLVAVVERGKLRCLQVAAGVYRSVLVMEGRKIFASGASGFQEVFLERNLPEFAKGEEFAVVRVLNSWSRGLCVTGVVLADLRHLHVSYVKIQNGLNLLAEKWHRNIDPEIVDTLVGYYPMISCRKSPSRGIIMKN